MQPAAEGVGVAEVYLDHVLAQLANIPIVGF
jgi:hypothetical protein